MTDNEINEAIAVHCGWIQERPNYVDDLNALRDAVKTLKESERSVFGEYVARKLGYDDDYYEGWHITPFIISEAITAPLVVLCECFLLTISKWKF